MDSQQVQIYQCYVPLTQFRRCERSNCVYSVNTARVCALRRRFLVCRGKVCAKACVTTATCRRSLVAEHVTHVLHCLSCAVCVTGRSDCVRHGMMLLCVTQCFVTTSCELLRHVWQERLQNHTLVVHALAAIGCALPDLRPEQLDEAQLKQNHAVVTQLLWNITRHEFLGLA